MPGMLGTDLIKQARTDGYTGHFIILSGYSDFKYAQTALHYGVSYYLTKPIDEDELIPAIQNIRERIEELNQKKTSLNQYLQKAKTTVLHDLLTQNEWNPSINYVELGLSSPIYQVVIYESYMTNFRSYNFSDLLRVTNQDNQSFEHLTIDNQNVILLKGNFALDRFSSCLSHYELGTQKGSPLDTIFLAYGQSVTSLSLLHSSYSSCVNLMQRRFFCDENQHVLSSEDLPDSSRCTTSLTADLAHSYSLELIGAIHTCNHRRISEILSELKETLYQCLADISAIKYFLSDLFLQVKQSITHTYPGKEIPFLHNAAILELINDKGYLYEILLYFTEQFEMIMRAIGSNSTDNIFDDILYYIDKNYAHPLKLETIAPLFGYNSSYLGKLFTQKKGLSFNSYLDSIRIKEATKLLDETEYKVYEIADMVGYRNVDYFHQKFKKSMHVSPAEYRHLNPSDDI